MKLNSGKYIINGDYSVDFEDDYKAAGATFKYKRPPAGQQRRKREQILAKGPIDQKVDVMVRQGPLVLLNVKDRPIDKLYT